MACVAWKQTARRARAVLQLLHVNESIVATDAGTTDQSVVNWLQKNAETLRKMSFALADIQTREVQKDMLSQNMDIAAEEGEGDEDETVAFDFNGELTPQEEDSQQWDCEDLHSDNDEGDANDNPYGPRQQSILNAIRLHLKSIIDTSEGKRIDLLCVKGVAAHMDALLRMAEQVEREVDQGLSDNASMNSSELEYDYDREDAETDLADLLDNTIIDVGEQATFAGTSTVSSPTIARDSSTTRNGPSLSPSQEGPTMQSSLQDSKRDLFDKFPPLLGNKRPRVWKMHELK